ncbi:MAG: hypothetical protein HZC47_09235 [Methanobacterium sp.]|uniref:hypothetical protein n=1 Tax=Methanobacterium sp. TaxID=2164 RepID=UPI003D65CA62|nr:hypothetical protein [Methanobacterium sp.]
MDLTGEEIEILQEQIIIVYKAIIRNNSYQSVFYKGIAFKQPETGSKLLNKLNEIKSPEEVLKKCIVELEEIKENKKLEEKVFYEIIKKHDLEELNEKYGIKRPEDLDKLDINELLGLI